MSLPTELIEMIIMQTIPEGFESMATTCQTVYAICVPFIEEHNALHKPLRAQFRHFSYYDKTNRLASPIRDASELIRRITDNPQIAHYIRNADFSIDSLSGSCSSSYSHHLESLKDCHDNNPLRRSFADSPHLKQAGLDWQTYYAKIEQDLRTTCYSQHAAAFLLTLLPNVENLCLPRKWKPNDETDKLINVVVRQAKQSLSYDSRSLACVRQLELPISLAPGKHCELQSMSVFLDLPRIESFRGYSRVVTNDDDRTTAFKIPYNGFAMNLETVYFAGCNISETDIAEFLKHSPDLKTLRYSHSTVEIAAARDWNIWKFVTAIEREAGSHLEELSLSYREYRGSIAPGKLSMSGFHRLQNLQLPLDIAVYTRREVENNDLFIDEFVPASVSQLSFITNGSDDHAMILNVLLRDFADRKEKIFILPALKRICLNCPVRPTNVYKERCATLRTEIEKAGLTLELISGLSWPFSSTRMPQYFSRVMARTPAYTSVKFD